VVSANLVAVRALLLAALLPALAGCEPSCKEACTHLLECEGVDTPRLALEECESSCRVQEDLYERWDDGQKRDAFAEMKRCVVQEECSAVADGACYDEDIYPW
jgi:hypothetical protein